MTLAPVILFAHRRPRHTRRVLECLVKNELLRNSVLYIFVDGPKDGASVEVVQDIEQVKSVIKLQKWHCEVNIEVSEKNLGLSQSIMSGVTKVIKTHGKAIVIEDDILVSPVFLNYMNASLQRFESNTAVGAVNAWTYPIRGLPRIYFRPGTSCWGWGTWADRWKLLVTDLENLSAILDGRQEIKDSLESDVIGIFEATLRGECDSWWVRWHISLCLNGLVGSFPHRSYIENIGFDGTGTNCGTEPKKRKAIQLPASFDPAVLETATWKDVRRVERKVRLYKSSFHGIFMQKAIRRLLANLL